MKNGSTNGLGLYKDIERKNDKIIADTKKKIKDYENKLQDRLKDKERQAKSGQEVNFTDLPERLTVQKAEKIPEDLSRYIIFLHPWMDWFLNFFILTLMFFTLFILTLIILR